jgi:nucleotide-binding universal stress UspA family protein
MPGIIVGIDGSERSRRALGWAINEAAARHAPLTVLTAIPTVIGYWGGTPVAYPGDEDLVKRARKLAQEETDDVLAEAGLKSGPLSVTVRAVNGPPAYALLQAAADADMIVVGSRGAGGFKRLLLGSVSTQVTQHAHCPVVVIPSGDV